MHVLKTREKLAKSLHHFIFFERQIIFLATHDYTISYNIICRFEMHFYCVFQKTHREMCETRVPKKEPNLQKLQKEPRRDTRLSVMPETQKEAQGEGPSPSLPLPAGSRDDGVCPRGRSILRES